MTDDAAAVNYQRYLEIRDSGHRDWVGASDRCDRYFCDEQWDPADRQKLEGERRPAVTVNMIKPIVLAVAGEYANRRADFVFKPRRNGATEEVAAVLTQLIMQIAEDNNYDQLETDVFLDGLIRDRGYFDVRMDFADNVQGEIRLRALDPRTVLIDNRASEYDPSTWRDVIVSTWQSLDDIEAMYGAEAANKLRDDVAARDYYADDCVLSDADAPTFGTVSDVAAMTPRDTERAQVRAVRVLDRQYYRMASVREFVDPVHGDTRQVPEGWDDQRAEQFAEAQGLLLRRVRRRRVRWTVSAGRQVLFDDWSPYKRFTVVPFFPLFRRGRPMGLVRSLLSPQDILNKTESQLLHVVNTTANSGWMVEAGSLVGMTEDDLAKRGAETGLVVTYAPGRAPPTKIQPNSVPTGLDHVGTRAAVAMQEISGVNRAMLGQESAEVSGVVLDNKQLRGRLQLQLVNDNLVRTRRILARAMLELVQMFYTEHRVIRVTRAQDMRDAPAELEVNAPTPEGALLHNLTLGEYDVSIASMPARDVYNESQLAEAIALREIGVTLPDHWVIGYSNLQRKTELAEEVKQLTGLGEPTEMDAQMQQLQVQMVQLQVEELASKVEVGMANAALLRAKAQAAADQPILERERLALEQEIVGVEQATRLSVQRLKELSGQLAAMNSNRTKIEQARMHALAKLRENPAKQRGSDVYDQYRRPV